MDYISFLFVGLVVGVYLTKKYQMNKYAVHIGEQIVNDVLQLSLSDKCYALLSNLTLPIIDKDNQNGTSQIDHVLITTRGLFVIETKYYRGSIVASVDSNVWYQYTHFDKHSFQNPLLQNYSHMKAIESVTGYPTHLMHNVVSFSGNADFKSERPPGVLNCNELKAYIESFSTDVLSINDVYTLAGKLQVHRLSETPETDKRHIAYLNSKHNKKAA